MHHEDSNLEDQFSVSGASDSLNVEQDIENIEQESDSISVLAGNDFDRLDLLHQEDSALQPPVLAIQPTITAIQPPNAACQPISSTSNAQTEVCSLQHDSSRPITSGLYDPQTSALLWSPSEEFTNFLEKHFRRKLTYDQVCDILEEQAVPSVDALVAPILDPPMLQHVAFQNKKFIQERDKELAGIQRAMLNATGHYAHCMINLSTAIAWSRPISNLSWIKQFASWALQIHNWPLYVARKYLPQ